MESRLAERWHDLTSFVSEPVRTKWWSRIVENYSNRPFSGFAHLERMFELFDRHKDKIREKYGFCFAIFFKNIVYNTHAADNAEKSSQMLREFSQETTLDQENYIVDLITKSGKGVTDANLTEGGYGTEDIHYLVDFDLAFLGDSEKEYIDHEMEIRKEFAHLSDQEYAMQRLKTLKLFVQIPNIFATEEVRKEREERARENIKHEIEVLQEGQRAYL